MSQSWLYSKQNVRAISLSMWKDLEPLTWIKEIGKWPTSQALAFAIQDATSYDTAVHFTAAPDTQQELVELLEIIPLAVPIYLVIRMGDGAPLIVPLDRDNPNNLCGSIGSMVISRECVYFSISAWKPIDESGS